MRLTIFHLIYQSESQAAMKVFIAASTKAETKAAYEYLLATAIVFDIIMNNR